MNLGNKLSSTPVLLRLQISVTNLCNFRCLHCYCDKSQKYEPDFKDILNLIDEANNLGCVHITLTGGEPFFRKDIMEIIRHITNKKIKITILTNGSLLNEELINELDNLNVFSIGYSLYGANYNTYKRFTGANRDQYNNLIKNIKLILKTKMALKISSCLTDENIGDIKEMKKFVESLGTSFPYKIDPFLFPGHKLGQDKGELACIKGRLTPKKINETSKYFEEYIETNQCKNEKFSSRKLPGRFDSCTCKHHTLYVNYDGSLGPCPLLLFKEYNIYKKGLINAWKNFLPEIYSQKKEDYPLKCKNCDSKNCSFCPALNVLETGNMDTPPDFLCDYAKHLDDLEKLGE